MRFSWLYSWLGFRKLSRRQRRHLKRKRTYLPLRVERLEDRLAPTVDTWTGGAGTLNWTDAANWSTNAVPISTDDVQINTPVSGPITINIANATNQSIHSLTDTTAALYVTGGSLTIAANSSIGQDLTLAGGTLTAGNLNVAGVFTQSGGTLDESGTLTVTNTMDWTGGTISGAGQTEIASGATLQIAGSGTLNGTLDNYGSTVWTAGTIYDQDGGVFTNEAGATFDAQFDGSFQDNDFLDATGGSFLNAGTFLKSAGTGSTTFAGYAGGTSTGNYGTTRVAFNNQGGTIDVQSGEVDLAGGGTATGQMTVSEGLVNVTGNTYLLAAGSTTTAAGGFGVASGGTLVTDAGASADVHTLLVSGGTVNNAGTLIVDGTMTWTGGTISGAGQTAVASGATLQIAGSGTLYGTLDNYGSAVWTGGTIYDQDGGVFTNEAGATFDAQFDGAFQDNDFYDPTGGSFVNAGTLLKSAGTGSTTFAGFAGGTGTGDYGTSRVAFNNQGGTIDVQSGEIDLAGGGTATGQMTVSEGLVNVTGNTFTLGDVSTGTGNGSFGVTGATLAVLANTTAHVHNLSISGGTVNNAGNLIVDGTMTWTGGTISDAGQTEVASGATLQIAGGGTLSGGTLDNYGSAVWTGGTIYDQDGGVFTNEAGASFDAQFDGAFQDNDFYDATGGSFVNAGTFLKSAGTGSTTFAGFAGGTGTGNYGTSRVAFNNQGGTIDVQSGTLDLYGPFANFVNDTLTGGTYVLNGRLQFNGAAIQTNDATIVLDGAASGIIDQNGNDALAGFTTNDTAGSFTIQNGRNYSTTQTFTNSGNVTIGSGSTFTAAGYTQDGGTTQLAGGSLVANSGVNIENGTLSGNGTVTGNVSSSGTVAPGSATTPGKISINGSYTQTAGGTLDEKIAGSTTPGTDYDQLVVSGAASLDGTINASIVNGFTPQSGDQYQIMEFASSSGDFATRNGFSLSGGNVLAEQINASNLALVVNQARIKFLTEPGNSVAGQLINSGNPVQVEIVDANGDQVTSDNSDTITLSLNQNSFDPASTLTATVSGGIATFNNLIIDKAADGYQISAFSPGIGSVASAPLFSVTPDVPAQLVFAAEPPSSAHVGDTLGSIQVQVEDHLGNLETGYSGSVTLALSSNPSALGGTVTENVSGGTATFGDLTVSQAGTYQLTATSGSVPSRASSAVTINPLDTSVAVTSISPSPLLVNANSQTINLTAQVSNLDNSFPVNEGTVSFTVYDPNGNAVGQPVVSNTVSNGSASATFTLAGNANALTGTYTVTASYVPGPEFLASSSTGSFTLYPQPTALSQSVIVGEGVAAPITLSSSDPSGDPLAYTVVQGPSDGQLSGTGASLTYTPDSGFTGSDSFQFTITDTATGYVSSPATITVTVVPPPVASDQSVAVGFGSPQVVTLGSTDPNGDPLSYTITTPPQDGQLSGSGPSLTYAPNVGFAGSDSFQFTVTDIASGLVSNVATMTLNVGTAPAASSQSVITGEGNAKTITLSSTDPNGDPLSYTVTAQPAGGQVTGSGANLTYTPNAGFTGSDSFQFTVTDTTTGLVSNTATVSITVIPPPVASNQSVATGEGIAQTITLNSTDPNGDPLTYTITQPPAGGQVTGSGANLTYTPNNGFAGSDSFQFTVTDTATGLVSNTATVTINVQPAYQVTVGTTATTVTNGTPVVLSGQATMTSNGAPAANVPVAVQIMVAGTTRTLTATTDASGNYSVTFQPLPNEAGQYSVAAADPDASNPAVQAHFQIVGMTATPGFATFKVVPNTPLTGQFTLTNLGDTPLTGITATVQTVGGPTGVTVQLTPPSQIDGNGTAALSYSITATNSAVSGPVDLHITSAEGAVLDIPVNVTVVPLTPQLVVNNPSNLVTGMLVGSQSLVSFTITNNGGAPSGDLQVNLPAASWLSLASPPTISSLAPGASATVTLQLTPPADLPLVQYQGTIGVSNAQTGISVPFTFTAITSAVGDVHVLVDDDFTFDEPGLQHVQGATVNLLNPYDNSQVVATAVTDATGAVTFSNIAAGPYVLQVQASGHTPYKNSFTVVAGITNNDEVFIARQFVTYSWLVQPTTIQDSYQVQLQTTFVTNVPAPVVTISAPPMIPTLAPGQTGTFNVTLTNHGLIAAQGVTLNLPTDPEYTFSTLSTQIGTIAAESSVVVPITVTRGLTADSDGSCSLGISGTYYYLCDNQPVVEEFATSIGVPGRVCTPGNDIDVLQSALADAYGGFGFGGGIFAVNVPSIITPSSCIPGMADFLAEVAQASSDASNQQVNTAPAVKGTDQAVNAAGPNSSVTPTAFMAIALGNLGLLNGQNGNDGYTPAQAAGMAPTIATFDQTEADLTAVAQKAANVDGDIDLTADLNLLSQVGSRLPAVTTAENILFGGDANWLNTNQSATLQQWLTAFFADTQDSSDGGETITSAEQSQLLATTLPSTVSTSEATEFINRWNQTVQYWSQGIYTAEQAPTGQSTDFLDLGAIQNAFNTAQNAELVSQTNGYSDPGAEAQAALTAVQNDLIQNGVCATVKLEIDQTATLTRSAFTGTLSITNSEASGSLTNVSMNITITDAQGNPANGKFYISSPTYSGAFSVINGNATLPDNTTGTISWTFIPDDSAASSSPTIYRIGGTFSYTDPDSGNVVSVPIFPAAITVVPQAQLKLNYFLQKDVFGDDPFTPQVEPSEPAVLGLLVTNVGLGTANDLSITTAQPQIVQNEKGLLDTFQIIGTQVGSQQVTPSLQVNLGDLAPGQTGDADFLLLSSLQGIFTQFTASFTHSDALGGVDTSLISSVQTHTLIHAGDFNFPGSTGEIDYLAEDNPNVGDLPDTIYFSDGTTAPVNIASNAQATATGTQTYTVTASVTSGWDYIQLPDPGAGYTLSSVVRSDGAVIAVSDQAWTTDRTFNNVDNSVDDPELHILDYNSTGSYTVTYAQTTTAPPTSTVTALPAFSPGNFTVSWSGQESAGGPGIASYNVYVSDNGGAFTPWLTGTTQTSATYTGVNGHTYAFYSIAMDLDGNVQPTPTGAQATTTVDAVAPTSSVTGLASFSPGSFTVSWSGSDNAGGSGLLSYSVFVSDDGGAYTPLLTNTIQTSTTFTGVDGHTYSFYSVATDNVGNLEATPSSAQASTTVDATPPTSTAAALPSFSPGSFTVSWSGSDNAGGSGLASYNVYISDNGGAFTPLLTDTTLTSTTFTGVDGHTYSFYSVATDNVGNVQATPASAQANTTVDAAPPTSSVAALPSFSPGSFTLNWSGSDGPGSGIAGYSVYVSDNGGAFTPLLTDTKQTSTTFTGINGHTYGFYSVATDNVGNVQSTPSSAQATTTVDTALPTSSVAALPTFSPAAFTLSWSGSDNTGGSGLASYSIYVSDNGGAFTPLLTDTKQSSTTFTGVDGHTYSFYSIATDNVGNIQPTPTSAQASTTISAGPPTASLTGPSSGVLYQPLTFTLGASDPSPTDQAGNFTYAINWGDGSKETIVGTSTDTHEYTSSGTYTVTLTATDQDGNVSAAVTQPVSVTATPQLQNGVLALPGTATAATYTLTPTLPTGASTYSMKVTRTIGATTTNLGTFAVSSGNIEVYGGPATDAVVLMGTANNDAFTAGSATVSELAAQVTTQATSFTVGLNAVTALTLKGAGGSDSLTGLNQSNTWNLTASNAGTLDGTTSFTGIENLIGGSAADDFVFLTSTSGTGSVTGSINGGSGANTLDFSARGTSITVNLATGSATGIGGGWTNIATVIGSTASSSTLVGANTPNVWDINKANSGRVNGTLSFANFQNLTGGSVGDNFTFLPGGSLSGNLKGISPANTLDDSQYGSPVTVNLAAKTATAIGGTWSNIQNFHGTATTDTLIGTNANSTWSLTSFDTGTVGSVAFTGFSNLTAGTGNDVFQFRNGASVSGAIVGGAGTNTLNYSLYNSGVYVNLQTLAATGTGSIASIQNVTGSAVGGDILVGDGNSNALTENAGYNLVIGGGGGDTLKGDSGSDILIAGSTIYDQNVAALDALLAAWDNPSMSYSLRVATLLSGVSYTDSTGTHTAALDADSTVSQPAGSGSSTLIGSSSGLDWFFDALTDVIKNQKKGEIISTL